MQAEESADFCKTHGTEGLQSDSSQPKEGTASLLEEVRAFGVEAYSVEAELSDLDAVDAMLNAIDAKGTAVDKEGNLQRTFEESWIYISSRLLP